MYPLINTPFPPMLIPIPTHSHLFSSMAFLLLNIFISLCLGLVASHAAVEPSEVYWKKVLPNSPMPKALKDLVHPPEWVNMVAGNGKPIDFGVSKIKGEISVIFKYPFNKHVAQTTKQDRAHVGDNKGKAEVSVTLTYSKSKHDQKSIQDSNFKATASALFFLEKNLHKGTQIKLLFRKHTTPLPTFLPLELAKILPFSSNKFPEILKYFSLKPSSEEAKMMKKTISGCEVAAVKGEEKYCASSLESMIDFTTSKLGKQVNAISMEANRESDYMQEYTIVQVKKMGGGKSIVCHKENYAYAVFYCHSTFSTKAYNISLMGKNGARAKAVGVCHTDTKDWDADYIAFQVLNVKPGAVPVCHLLPQDHVIWVPY